MRNTGRRVGFKLVMDREYTTIAKVFTIFPTLPIPDTPPLILTEFRGGDWVPTGLVPSQSRASTGHSLGLK